MPISPGTRLGPYEVVAPIGAGGMGEVYRARDTRLGRDVAIKVLPQHLSDNADVRARFEREAKTISSLNHPNICTLFDVGRAPVAPGAPEIDYLVMELVEGETLAQRLQKGALPLPDVLRLGAQIADALDRAHRAGVVHRDLKPGNVMLTKSGAKLMDFGLARATTTSGPVSGSGATMAALTSMPTMMSPLTAEGAIVGTFQYMSPEQLEGREADARSDLWALGCVLYEMATGRRAFEGRSQASLITAIMGAQPAPLLTLMPTSPPALDRVVSALLAKDADDRIQTAHDVKLQLGWLGEPGSQSSASQTGAAAPVARRWKSDMLSRVGYAVGVLGLAAAAYMASRDMGPKQATVVSQIVQPRGLELAPYWSSMVISPDGQHVVASATRDQRSPTLWLWRLDSPEPQEISGVAGGVWPTWSPDGRNVAYVGFADKGLSRVGISGGTPTRVADVSDPRGLSWGSKDVIVFAPAPSGALMKVPAKGGAAEVATELDAARGEAGHRFPCFLPDGEHFLFAVVPGGPNGFTTRVGSLKSKTSKVLMQAESGVSYIAPGYVMFVVNNKITVQRFDVNKLECVGERITLGDAPIRADADAEPVGSSSRDGALLYPDLQSPDARLEWLGRNGLSRGTVPLPKSNWTLVALSPDQRSALATSDGDLWQVDLERGVPTPIMSGIDPFQLAQWSPDGSRIVATSRAGGREVLQLINAGGSGARDSVALPGALFIEAQGWAPDGKSLLVSAIGAPESPRAGNSWDLFVVPLDGGAPRPYLATPAFERRAKISPDGRWVCYVSRDRVRADLVIDSYPEPGHRLQVLAGEEDRDIPFFWGRGGKELIYATADNQMVSLPLTLSGNRLQVGKPTTLFDVPSGTSRGATLDGERFLISREEDSSRGPAMRLVQGWTGWLKR